MPESTLTSKGQITVPKVIRDVLKLRRGQRVEFHLDDLGQVIMRPRNLDVRELKGSVRSPRKRPVTLREMDEAVAEGFSRL